MALGKCAICAENDAKYKCPKCSIAYCSLPCFKNTKHDHLNVVTTEGASEPIAKVPQAKSATSSQLLFESVAEDPVIKSLLGYKSLQVHLAVVLRLLSDSRITNEPLAENRREIANLRLCDLRTNGVHENELVEEFVQRVLYLTESHSQAV